MGMFDKKECPDCDAPGAFGGGNGKCSDCHGTGGETDPIGAFADALSGTPQTCKTCGGSGRCQTCNGEGYI